MVLTSTRGREPRVAPQRRTRSSTLMIAMDEALMLQRNLSTPRG